MLTSKRIIQGFAFPDIIIVASIIILPLIYVGNLEDTLLLPRLLFLDFLIIISGLFIFVKGTDLNIAPTHPILYLLLCFVLVTALSYVSAGNKAEALLETSKIILIFFLFLFFLIAFINKESSMLFLSRCILVSVLTHGTIMISEFFVHNVVFNNYKSLCNVTGLMGNKNIFSEYMLYSLPFTIFNYVKSNKVWKLLSITGIVLICITLLLLQTRSTWVALVCVCFLLIVLLFCYKRKNNITLMVRWKKLALPFSIFIILFFFFAFQDRSVRNSIGDRAISIVQFSKSGSANGRLVLWDKSLALFNEHRLTGVGAGNWKISFQKYGQFHPSNVFNVRVMNDYILVLCETGLPGLLLYLTLLIYSLVVVLRLFFNTENPEIRLSAFIVSSSLLLFIVCSFFSFPKERAESFVFLSALVALAVALNSHKENLPTFATKIRLGVSIPAILLGFSISIVLAERIKGEFYLAKALDSRNLQQHNEVINNINKAESFFYTIDGSSTPIAWYKGVARFQLGDTASLHDFELAYKYNPYHLHVLNNLATVLDHAGRKKEAIRYYKEAIAVSPHFLSAIINLTAVYYNQGDFLEAERTINLWKGKRLSRIINLKKIIHEKVLLNQ